MPSQIGLGLRDILRSVSSWRHWLWLAHKERHLQGNRMLLKTHWDTLSFVLFILPLAYLYSILFQLPVSQYLPHLAAGFLCWTFILSAVLEGCNVYIANARYVKEFPLPLSFYCFSSLTKVVITFLKNLLFVLIISITYSDHLSAAKFIVLLPAFLLLYVNALSSTLLLGTVTARFRDISQVIGNTMRALFFVTPVLWTIDLRSQLQWIATLNPLYHFIELVRAPMLGEYPTIMNWSVALGFTICSLTISAIVFGMYHRRIIFWL